MKMVMRLVTVFATLAGTILAGMGLAVAQEPYPPPTVLPEVIVQTPAAPPAPEVAAAPVQAPAAEGGLAATGGEFTLWMALALGLLIAGALLVFVSRKRRSSEA